MCIGVERVFLVESPAVAAVVNGRLSELTRPLTSDHDVTPVLLSDNDGAKIYRRSLAK